MLSSFFDLQEKEKKVSESNSFGLCVVKLFVFGEIVCSEIICFVQRGKNDSKFIYNKGYVLQPMQWETWVFPERQFSKTHQNKDQVMWQLSV